MARIFIAMPQYRPMSRFIERSLAELFEMEGWEPMGLHPRVLASIRNLKTTKHFYGLHVLRFDGLIERSENNLFGEWLHCWKNGDKFDYILRLDEDIEFHPSAIQSMIDADKPIIGGAYSYKTDTGLKGKKSVCKYLPEEKNDEKGILKILWLNGGFQFFRSDALFKLMEAYPELRYERVPEGDCDATESYALWTSMIKEMDTEIKKGMRILLSEDYAICQRAIDIGMDIYLDTKIELCHWDTHVPDPELVGDCLKATGYLVGKEPIIVTEKIKPWRQEIDSQESEQPQAA